MIVSFCAYVTSFVFFAFGADFWSFLPAMLFFAFGDAFRTGTHKAMIFDWLTRQGRAKDKAQVYGITRSWSKLGSAFSVIMAAAILALSREYKWLFWAAIPPYCIGIVNFILYPKYLDGSPDKKRSAVEVFRVVGRTLKSSIMVGRLRALMIESSFFDGFFNATKDYLQPLLKAAAVGLPLLLATSQVTRTAVLVGAVYFVLYLASSVASRKSHLLNKRSGDENRTAAWLWMVALGLYALAGAGMFLNFAAFAIAAFVCLEIMRNIWKPVMVSRFHSSCGPDDAATTLSVANQCKTLTLAVTAPLLGLAVDWTCGNVTSGAHLKGQAIPPLALWPVAAAGVVSCIGGWMINRSQRTVPAEEPSRVPAEN